MFEFCTFVAATLVLGWAADVGPGTGCDPAVQAASQPARPHVVALLGSPAVLSFSGCFPPANVQPYGKLRPLNLGRPPYT